MSFRTKKSVTFQTIERPGLETGVSSDEAISRFASLPGQIATYDLGFPESVQLRWVGVRSELVPFQ